MPISKISKFLVEELLKEESKVKDYVVVYSGRFQPFHKGHYATYDHLVKKFGKENVFIATSNKTDNDKSPFDFKEKKSIITNIFGIPSNKIVQVKNPYAPTEILDKYDENSTALITVVGEKDSLRLGGKYFSKYKGKVEAGYKDKGYVYTAPSQPNPISGTDVRNFLSKGSDTEKKEYFLKIYPKFNQKIFDLIIGKLKKINEIISETSRVSGGGDDGEPETGYVSDGQKRVLDGAKPEPWFKQGSYKQIDIPKGDYMRGKGKDKDTESTFRKVYYKLKNVEKSTLNPVEKPESVDNWKEITPKKKNIIKKDKRYWELEEAKNIITNSEINEIADEMVEALGLAMGYPSKEQLIQKEKERQALRKKMDKQDAYYQKVNEANGEDDKYTHIGYGRYKKKGEEKNQNAQTFKKDDSGKFIPITSPTSFAKSEPKVNIFDKPQPVGADVKPKGETPNKIPATKIKSELPNADSDTFNAPSDINRIPDETKREISMKIDELDKLTKDAKEKGEKAPNFNLCKITVPGTNLYCDGNQGIPREDMPQFKGKPVPGSPADKLPKDKNGEVDTEPLFKQMLKEKGIKTVETEIPSDRLKATQSELVGSKVAGMAKALEENPNHPSITAPIYVSRDGYVIDGHHRWAAVTSAAIKDGKPANMKVIVVDMDIKDAIPMTNKFAEEQGVAAKKADANTETPSDVKSSKEKEDIKSKISKWAEKEKEFFKKNQNKPNSETRRSIGEALRDKVNGAKTAILKGLKHEAELFKSAGSAVKSFVSGKELNPEEKKALIKVSKKVLTTALVGAATGGIAHGILPFAKHLAIEFVPHVVGETILAGASRAALFADVNDDERYLNAFIEKIIDGIENMEIPNDVLVSSINTWNDKKNQNEDKIPGGLAKGKTLIDLAKKWDSKGYYDPKQYAQEYIKPKLMKGIKVEMEHTTDVRIATEIAMDHLWEDINYYDKLAKIEKQKNELKEEVLNIPKSLGIPRKLMPQIKSVDIKDYLSFLKDNGIKFTVKELFVSELKMTQKDLNSDKIKYLMGKDKSHLSKPVIVSSDKFILDGHHRVVALFNLDKNFKIKVVSVDLKMKDLLLLTKKFSKVSYKNIDEYVMYKTGHIMPGVSHRGLGMDDKDLERLENPKNESSNTKNASGFQIVDVFDVESEISSDENLDLKNPLGWESFDKATNKFKKKGISEAYTKGQIFAGKIKIGGQPVEVEVELVGADNKKNVFITKVINIDKKYWSKLPSDGILEIPARIFRTPGGGWYKVKTPKAFSENWDSEYEKVEESLKEDINVPVKVGDTILMGKFKNKKVVVKNIGKDEHGMPTINGKKAVTFRLIKENIEESNLLLEGGAYGHMNHPFDLDVNLTFGQLKDIVKKALTGKLELTREKTDGQALAISWVNGRLVAARNKSHLKNKGKEALDINGLAQKFANRGALTDAYNFAMKDLSVAIGALTDKQKEKIFKGGSSFMNIEVIYPESMNVIPYGQPLLVFHGSFDYDEAGNVIGEDTSSGRMLAGMIKQINQNVQSKYSIQGPPITKLPKSEELSKLQPKYLAKINKLQNEFKLKDNQGVADYHQAWWTNFVEKGAKKLDSQQKIGLVKRWAFLDKGFRIKDIKDDKIREWAEGIDKGYQQKISKENLMKFEEIFLGVGADVLSFMSSVLTVNPDSAKRAIVDRLEKTIKDIQASGDPKKIEKLKLELSRLESLGGFDKIVPTEGIVFSYNNYTMKLTGAFAPLNQLLGIMYYG